MRQSQRTVRFFLALALVFALAAAPAAEARDFAFDLVLKTWNVSLSADGVDGGEDLFFPGLYATWGVTDHVRVSASYVEGEVDFSFPGSTTTGSFEEVDSDLMVSWSFTKLDVGVGYRDSEFTTSFLGINLPTVSSTGPMVYLGGGGNFKRPSWGYYWGLAYMFEDLDDDDGSQEQINGEGGFRWFSKKNFSILFGYRYKEYSGDGTGGLTFDGPVVSLGYSWR